MSRILAAGAARMKLEAENYEARIAELAAENERLRQDRDEWKRWAEQHHSDLRRTEALSRTGAVKVKALEWEDSVSPLIGPNVYFSRAATVFGSYRTEQRLPDSWMITAPNGDAIRDENGKLAHHETLEAAKAAAQADYERRILSALEPAAPEGRQEAMRIGDAVLEWMVKFDLLDGGNEYYVADVLAVLNDLTPSTRPSEQAVTEAEHE